jgi:23S rRNA (guanine745-N1)-methyltransferase
MPTPANVPLTCSVRDCGSPLARSGNVLTCRRGHAYDVARSGYVNLLQPQDRKSFTAGDPRVVVEARARLLAGGVGRSVIDAVAREASALDLPDQASVVELGSGSGELLGTLARMRRITGIGLDLSRAAATIAARRYPELTWVVANADRRLPIEDGRVALILSLHARRNPPECRRILSREGRLLVAIPASDDLIELRAQVLGEAAERDRGAALLADHAEHFRLLERSSAREHHRLDRQALLDLLRGTYRAERTSAADRVATLDSMDVTVASDIFLFAPR